MPSGLPTVESIDTTVFRLPMQGALRWGKASTLSEVRHVLVTVRLSDGSSGVAEAPPRPTIYGETVYSITSVIKHELAPRVIGQPIDGSNPQASAAAIGALLHQVKNNHAAKSAVDIALYDAMAQQRGTTLAAVLGCQQQRLPVSYILGIGDRETMLAEAERVFSLGVRMLKVKVGRDWDEDLARIGEIQALLGPTMALYADANECFDAENAEHRLATLHDLGLRYCEEPLPVEYLAQRAALRVASATPIIADDSCFTPRDLVRELAMDTFDILNIKTARTGYTDSLGMLAAARRAGKGVMIGSQASAGLGTVRAALLAACPGIDHPSELSFFLKLKEDIVANPMSITDGFIDLADVMATQLDWDLLRDATVDIT